MRVLLLLLSAGVAAVVILGSWANITRVAVALGKDGRTGFIAINAAGRSEVFSFDLASCTTRKILTTGLNITALATSGRGRLVAECEDRTPSGKEARSLWEYRAATNSFDRVTPLGEASYKAPCFDSEVLCYLKSVKYLGAPVWSWTKFGLYRREVNDHLVAADTPVAEFSVANTVGGIAWATTVDERGELYVVRVNLLSGQTTKPGALGETNDVYGSPCNSQDGREAVYLAGAPPAIRLNRIRTDESGVDVLRSFRGEVDAVMIRSDGHVFVVERRGWPASVHFVDLQNEGSKGHFELRP